MRMHLCKIGFMPGYNIWTEHGEQPVSEPTLEYEYDNHIADCLDEMLADFGDAMHSVDEEPTTDAKAFYAMLAASKEWLHSFTSVAQLTAVARLMAIKSHTTSLQSALINCLVYLMMCCLRTTKSQRTCMSASVCLVV
jgi:hypothetical protein